VAHRQAVRPDIIVARSPPRPCRQRVGGRTAGRERTR